MSAAGSLPGFEVPLHRSLTEPILMGGAPRALAIVIGTTAAAIGLGLQQWVAGPGAVGGRHTIAVLAARRDPDVAVVLVRHAAPAGLVVMLSLAEYRPRADRLADHLPWAALAGPGIVLNKDGSVPAHGALPGAGPGKRDRGRTGRPVRAGQQRAAPPGLWLGAVLRGERRPAPHYPDSAFPDPASALVDAERRAAFEGGRPAFESAYHLTLVYLPPPTVRPRRKRPCWSATARPAGATGTASVPASSRRPTASSTC